jgi:hypothetical protein
MVDTCSPQGWASRIGRLLGPSNPGWFGDVIALSRDVSALQPWEAGVSFLLRSVLDSSRPMIGGLAVFGAAVLGVFVTYLGVAMTIALFHRDRARRAVALEIFRDLLALFTRSSR